MKGNRSWLLRRRPGFTSIRNDWKYHRENVNCDGSCGGPSISRINGIFHATVYNAEPRNLTKMKARKLAGSSQPYLQ